MNAGDTFFGLDERGHLWILMTSETADARVAVANLTTHDPDHRRICDDRCVVLRPGEHSYIGADEPALASAVATAYPKPVRHIHSQTDAPSSEWAAAMLLEQLFRPGFDPAQDAEATRRYVRRKASIVVMEHKKQEAPDRYPWTRVGISERRYYKLLPLFAEKVNGRYDYDHSDVVARMKVHLEERDRERAVRTGTLELLRSRGFSDATRCCAKVATAA